MNSLIKPLINSFLVLATSLVAQARIIQHWSDQELLEKSDLVVIATPTTSADTQERTDLPGFLALHVIGVETGFAISAVVKGDKALKNFVLHHYRADGDPSFRGPNFIAFKPDEKRKFLLFLKREADGRYAPTVGQVDPGFQGIAALVDPVSGNSNPATLADVARPTSPTSRAPEEKNILAAGDWSEPVAGVPDKNTGRGGHRPIIRGRLLLCESPKNHQTAAYLELQDCGDIWGGSREIYCDMGGCHLELRDTKGQPLPSRGFAFSGGAPGAHWMTLPCDTTVRLRISPYASFSFASAEDYFMSGSFVVNPPADHTGLDVWQGTLKLPAMKIVVPKTTDTADGTGKTSDEPASSSNGEKPDPIDQLVAKLSATDGLGSWVNGSFPVIRLPETATPEQILEQVFKFTGFDKGHVKDFKILQSRNVQITGGSYTAAEVQTDLGKKIVLFTAGGAWSRVYDANEPAKAEAPLSKEAQAVLNGLNQKAADPASAKTSPQALIEAIKHRPNTVKGVYLTLTGSTVNLKDGSSLQTDSIELQGEVAKAAKDAGIAFYWE